MFDKIEKLFTGISFDIAKSMENVWRSFFQNLSKAVHIFLKNNNATDLPNERNQNSSAAPFIPSICFFYNFPKNKTLVRIIAFVLFVQILQTLTSSMQNKINEKDKYY